MALFLKNLAFTVLVPGVVAGLVPLRLAAWAGRLAWPGWGIGPVLALTALLTGAGLYLCSVWQFAVRGGGTPAPVDAPRRLVIQGPYRFVRNPMYIGVWLVVAGWALLFRLAGIALYACAVGAAFHAFVVWREEPALARAFGDPYRAYRDAVRRWVPGPRYRP